MPPQKRLIKQPKEPVRHEISRVLVVKRSPMLSAVVGQHPVDVAPPRSIARRMGVMFLVAKAMVLAVSRYPHDWWAFTSQRAEQRQHPSHGAVRLKTVVRQ